MQLIAWTYARLLQIGVGPEQLALGIATLIAGVLGVPITTWLRKYFQDVTGVAAGVLAYAVAALLTLVAMLVTGAFVDIGSFSWEQLQGLATFAFGIMTMVYRVLERRSAMKSAAGVAGRR